MNKLISFFVPVLFIMIFLLHIHNTLCKDECSLYKINFNKETIIDGLIDDLNKDDDIWKFDEYKLINNKCKIWIGNGPFHVELQGINSEYHLNIYEKFIIWRAFKRLKKRKKKGLKYTSIKYNIEFTDVSVKRIIKQVVADIYDCSDEWDIDRFSLSKNNIRVWIANGEDMVDITIKTKPVNLSKFEKQLIWESYLAIKKIKEKEIKELDINNI